MKRWTEIPWPEIDELKERMIAFIAVGSIEQHGRHLPLGTDTYIPVGITDIAYRKLSEKNSDIAARSVMLQPFFYTYAKESDFWPGTVNLDGGTFSETVRDVLSNLFRQGIRNAVIVNGHMECLSFVFEGISLALEKYPYGKVVSVNWWDFISDGLISDIFGDRWPGWAAEHAALMETSLMLYLYPELVRLEKMCAGHIPGHKSYKIFPQPESTLPASGMFAPAEGASARIGELVAGAASDGLVGALEEIFKW